MKVLIIGYGSIGKRHADVLSSIDEVEDVHIVSKQQNLDFVTFETLEQVSDLNYYDYYVIASITSLHLTQLKYIDNIVRDKIILVEKPLNVEFVDIKVHNNVFVAYNLRFHPLIKQLRELLKCEHVLNINIQAGQYLPTWRPDRDYSDSYSASIEKGGGVLLDLSHEIDYLLWLFGDIKTLSSINRKISDLNIESDDFVIAIGTMKNGAIYSFSMDYISKISMRRIVVNTMDNTYDLDFVKNRLISSDKTCKNNEVYKYSNERNNSYRDMHIQALGLSDENNVATLDDSLKVLSVIDEVRKSSYEK